MKARSRFYLGVDIGSSKIAVSLWVEGGGQPGAAKLGGARWATEAGGPQPNLESTAAEGQRLLDSHPGAAEELVAIGISGGGPVDPERGIILSVPNLPGWTEVPVARELTACWQAPAFLENDANASAVAEWLYGAGRGARHLAFLTCSTGIGAGLILDGKLLRGSRFLAGEVGHQVIVPGGLPCGCGRRGCLEAYASGAGMARRLATLRLKEPGLPATALEVVERARAGDGFSLEFLRETAEYLAMGLANLVFILDLERIVLGTIAVGAGELLLEPLRAALERLLWPAFLEKLAVVPAALGSELGDHAALAVALAAGRPA